MLSDTLSGMVAARKLYERVGFMEIEGDYRSVEDAVLYKLNL